MGGQELLYSEAVSAWHDPVVRAVALLALVVALLTGCGGDDSSSVVVPYVVGLSEPNAIQITEAAGMTPLVERGPTTEADKGFVYSQFPREGSVADEGQILTIRVSLGRP